MTSRRGVQACLTLFAALAVLVASFRRFEAGPDHAARLSDAAKASEVVAGLTQRLRSSAGSGWHPVQFPELQLPQQRPRRQPQQEREPKSLQLRLLPQPPVIVTVQPLEAPLAGAGEHSPAGGIVRGGSGGNPFNAMRQTAAEDDVRLFVAVVSAAANRDKRDAIRNTWGSDKRLHRVVFICAKPRKETAFDALRAEAVAARDVVVLPHVWEHYTNITHQTLEATRAAALDLAMTHLLKVDDDSFVRVPLLLDRLRWSPREYGFLGYVENPGGRPHRDTTNKWFVSTEDWGDDKYPVWAHGAGYVLTADLVREIAAGAALKPQQHRLFKLEDVAMGSWVDFVGRERGVQVHYSKDERFNFSGCSPYDLVSHRFDAGLTHCSWVGNGRCCSRQEGAMYAGKLRQLGDVAQLHAWRP